MLSPTLFTCYIDGLLHRLKSSGNGCFVGDEYVGGSYTDDLIIVAPSVSALKTMITHNICEQYAVEYHIKFNGKKSELMCFDKRGNTSYAALKVKVNNEFVKVVDTTMDYLGHTIVNDRHGSLISSVKREYAAVLVISTISHLKFYITCVLNTAKVFMVFTISIYIYISRYISIFLRRMEESRQANLESST